MKPIKSLSPFALWLLRLALLLMVGLLVWPNLKAVEFTNPNSMIYPAFGLFALLLVIGGLMSKHTLTMLSGLAIMLASAWFIYQQYAGITTNLATFALTGVVGLHFFVNGNK